MAITVNFDGATLRKPGAYSKTTVNLTGGFPVAPAGIVGIVGEAEAGAPGSAEDIKENFFGPNDVANVVAKYKEGPIVDAFKLLVAPSNDARVTNGANRVFIYKTNASTQASATLPSSYGTIKSQNYGKQENLINFTVEESQEESGPALAAFNWMPDPTTATSLLMRANGGAEQTDSPAADATPATVSSAIDAFTDIAASGGTARGMLDATRVSDGSTLEVTTATAGIITVTIAGASPTWATTPTVGDTLHIPTTSAIAGGGGENAGGYLITAATTSTVTAAKLGDPSVTAIAVGATDIAATADVESYSPITVTYDGTTPDGVGASLEAADNSGTVALEELWYGGEDRGMLSSTLVSDGSTLALSADGTSVTITISSNYAGSASPGDLLWIRPGSVLAPTLTNVGAYRVTAATGTTITATKFSGTPTGVSAADIAATTDIEVFKGVLSSSTTNIVNTSSAEQRVQIEVNRQSDNLTEDSGSLGGDIALLVGYDGTTATMTITSTQITTSVTGGSGSSLTLTKSDFDTLSDLATFINSQTGYTAAVGSAVLGQQSPDILDRVSAVGIGASVAGDTTGRIKRDSSLIQEFFDSSELVTLTRTDFAGLPAETSRTFLSGGAKGGTSASSVTSGIDEMQKVRINSLVPLFSRDATDDILDELTEASSTYQIDAVNAAVKTHCLLMSNTLNRSERNGYVSFKGTFSDTRSKATNLASERISMSLQDVRVLQTDGTLGWKQPWGMAAVAAGMQAGAPIGEPMTFKFINVSGIRHTDFDPATDVDSAIDSGLLFAESPDQGGFRVVVGNTTYGKDANFVNNRISVLYAADTVAFNLRRQLEDIFVGVNAAVATASTIKSSVNSIMSTFRAANIIVGDDTNDGRGYKNLNVTVTGNTVDIEVTITPAQGVDFILPSIVLDNVRQSA